MSTSGAAAGTPSRRGVRLEVRDADGVHLVYGFETAAEAAEMCAFLRPFLPRARFLLEPLVN